jgi:UPF0755 protein
MISYSLRSGNGAWKRALVICGLILLIILSGVIYSVRRVYTENLQPVSAAQRSQQVTIPIGSSAKEIAIILKDAGLIRETWAFEWYVRNHNLRDKMQAGTYSLRPNQGVAEIATILTQGKVATDLVTILPAQRLDQIRTSLINSGFAAEDVDNALKPELYTDHPALVDKPAGASLEGYLYPETFQKTANTKPEEIIRAALDETQARLTPEVRAGIVKQGLTVHQGIVLASIVEQEVSNGDDRKVVAQVFLKRLHENITLGSDVTAFYGAIMAGQEPKISSVNLDTPYNTRIHAGLPPGPISNISGSSLSAVANPASTNYLFFVAGDDGKTYFSNTQAEHEALTREHCKKLCFEG